MVMSLPRSEQLPASDSAVMTRGTIWDRFFGGQKTGSSDFAAPKIVVWEIPKVLLSPMASSISSISWDVFWMVLGCSDTDVACHIPMIGP